MLQFRFKNYALETKQFKKRVVKAAILIATLLIFLIIRLCHLQIFNYKLYDNLATNNRLEKLPVEPNRGLIYDRNGVLLAENLPVFSLSLIAENIQNINKTIDDLKTIIEISPNDLKRFNKSLKTHQRFEPILIKSKLTQEEVATFYVYHYRFPGVVIDTQMIRHYPFANETVNALGYVGRINKQELQNVDPENYGASKFIGKVGIEKYYENMLHGKNGYRITEVDSSGKGVRTLETISPTPGDTLYLTIDSKLHTIALEALGEERGAVVAIDPNNGEILALVSAPSYDPNIFTGGIDNETYDALQFSSDKPMYNRATKSLYPFASTIKPFIALQALDTKTITNDFKIYDPGWFKLENRKQPFRDYIHGGHGIVNLTKAIMVSCDVFFYTLSLKLGIEKIDNILERFGFGNKTNIDILEESAGIVASPKWVASHTNRHWYPGDTVNSSIGQGYMKTTALQLAHGVAAIAMRGQRFQPHLLLATKKHDGSKITVKPTQLSSVTLKNPNNWDIIISAMKEVVTNPKGTAYTRFGSTSLYTVAGKTGGAQLFHHKIVNENPTPASEESIPKHLRNHNLFIAFAPVENPKIAIAVITENSIIAPQVARKVLDGYLNSLDA